MTTHDRVSYEAYRRRHRAREIRRAEELKRRRIFYMASPVSGDVTGNVERALRWLAWLRKNDRTVAFIAPWIAGILCGEDDSDPDQRERALQDCEATAALCFGIVLVGGRVSTGMDRERRAVIAVGGVVVDLTHLGQEPPAEPATATTSSVTIDGATR